MDEEIDAALSRDDDYSLADSGDGESGPAAKPAAPSDDDIAPHAEHLAIRAVRCGS